MNATDRSRVAYDAVKAARDKLPGNMTASEVYEALRAVYLHAHASESSSEERPS